MQDKAFMVIVQIVVWTIDRINKSMGLDFKEKI
jgi:hypothetical protein